MAKLTKKLRGCVAFARMAKEARIEAYDLAELVALGNAAFSAGVRQCNTGASCERQHKQFEEKAKELGFRVSWPGLAPLLDKGGRTFSLPEV